MHACVDSLPASANFEDFMSMAVTAILENVEYIIAIELLCASQATELPMPGGDRILSKDRKSSK
jgi:histidine ammonia-lyase